MYGGLEREGGEQKLGLIGHQFEETGYKITLKPNQGCIETEGAD